MRLKTTVFIIILSSAFLMNGCSSIYDSEYYHVSDYSPSAPSAEVPADFITVNNFSELKIGLLRIVNAGTRNGRLIFSESYPGEPAEDMASACWEVRTQDALCAYCVENIAYELSNIVTYYEADVHVFYSPAVVVVEDIISLQYSTDIERHIEASLKNSLPQTVLLVAVSTYSEDTIKALVSRVYMNKPSLCPAEPKVSVVMFTGVSLQKLYEISFDYGMSTEELDRRKQLLSDFELNPSFTFDASSQLDRAYTACNYLSNNCEFSENPNENTIYHALIEGKSGEEGLAFAFVDLCSKLGLECRIIYGQRDREDACWNIVKIDDQWYHVDPASAVRYGIERGFLFSDEDMWNSYRWNTSKYPSCSGDLNLSDVFDSGS